MNLADTDPFGEKETNKRYDEGVMHLGQAAISFQRLESDLAMVVAFLCYPEDYEAGQIVTAELSFKGLCSLASSMFRYWKPKKEDIKEFETLLSQCFTIESRRNELIHSTYGMSGFWEHEASFQRTKIRAKFKKGKREICETLTKEELMEFSTNCTKLGCEIHDFNDKISAYWNERIN